MCNCKCEHNTILGPDSFLNDYGETPMPEVKEEGKYVKQNIFDIPEIQKIIKS